MIFLWPDALWLLPACGLLILSYLGLLRRRNKQALRYADLGLAREAMAGAQRLRAHFPAVLLLAALVLLAIALARPSAVTTAPGRERTVVLVIDVSYSMAAADVPPSRLAAAQAAASSLVQRLSPDVRVAVLQFAGNADVVQSPIAGREHVLHAIDRLEFSSGSSPALGLLGALLTLFPDADIGRGYDVFGAGRVPPGFDRFGEASVGWKRANAAPAPTDPTAAIVLFTDGEKTIGPDPVTAAVDAAGRGVRVFTVGVGTVQGGRVDLGTSSLHVRFDDEPLRRIAAVTSGRYAHVVSAEDGARAGSMLGKTLMPASANAELTAMFAAAGLLFALASGTLSLLRTPYLA